MNTNYIVKKMFTGSVLRVLSLGSTVLISFFMMPFLVHNLGNEQYGLWLVVAAIVGFYGFFDLGITTAVGKYAAASVGKEDYEDVNRIINTSFFLFTGIGIIIVLLSVTLSAFSTMFESGGNAKTFAILISIIGTTIGITFPLRPLKGILLAQMRFDLPVYCEFFKLIIRTIMVVFFINMGYGVISLALITFFTEIVGYGFEFYFVKKFAPFVRFGKSYFYKQLLKDFVKYSWSVMVINISEMARTRVIPVFVTSFLGLNFVVLYGIALRIVEYFEALMKNCIGFVMPVLSRFDGQNNADLVKRTFEYTAMISVVITVFISASLAFYGKEFIQVWMGREYIQAYDILMLILIPMGLSFAQSASKELLLGISKHNIYAILSFSSVVCLSIFSVIISARYGVNSIAYATVLGLTIFEIVKPYYTAKCLGVSVMSIYMLYLTPAIKSIAILVAYYLIAQHYLVASFGSIALLVGIQTFLFALGGYFFIIPKQLRRMINRTIVRPVAIKAMSIVS